MRQLLAFAICVFAPLNLACVCPLIDCTSTFEFECTFEDADTRCGDIHTMLAMPEHAYIYSGPYDRYTITIVDADTGETYLAGEALPDWQDPPGSNSCPTCRRAAPTSVDFNTLTARERDELERLTPKGEDIRSAPGEGENLVVAR